MLIQCPECGLQASDKATTCPHCGYPLQGQPAKNEKRKSNRRKRLPNGFGQITKLRNRNLRNPYRAMVTVGKDENGKPICKLLQPRAYFLTYNDAYAALVEYNKNPYDLSPSITMRELYDRWSTTYFETIEQSTIKSIKASWAYCSEIYDMKVTDVRARHIKGCINDGRRVINGVEKYPSASFKQRIQSTFNSLLNYAVEYEIVDRNYAETVTLGLDNAREVTKSRKEHMCYTDEEMKLLWDNVNIIPYVDLVLIQCYSGWRPQEIGRIKLEDCDIEKWTFKGGMKTDAGEERTVPIHTRIRDLVKRRYDEAVRMKSKYLFNCNDGRGPFLNYDKYRDRFLKILERLEMNPEHKCHDGRIHFVTMAKKYHMDEYSIKLLVGHAITDVTEKVYTKRDIEWLREELQKIR